MKHSSHIPIFIITCNRLTVLKQSIASYHNHIKSNFEIVIHDNFSTYPPLINYLNDMEQNGIKVYRYQWEDDQKMQYAQISTLVALTIERWYQENDSAYYIVTDPDIELDQAHGDILDFYMYLLELFPKVQVVGPMLRIDDIPDCYPRKQDVIKRHASFWNREPFRVEYNGRFFEVHSAFIDTTFGMYRKAFRFKNYNPGIRTCPPYSARHLDWYLDPDNMTEDQIYYATNASRKIVHWGLIKPGTHVASSGKRICDS